MESIISYKKIGGLALPIILSQSVVLVNGLINLAFIGPLGTDAIAAVAMANAVCAAAFNFLEGFRLGTTVLIAKASAEQDRNKGTGLLTASLFLAAIIGALLYAFAPDISRAVYASIDSDAIRRHGAEYLRIMLRSVPFTLGLYVFVGLFRGLRDATTPLYGIIAVCLIDTVLSYLLVYGKAGLPCLGVKGAALATMTANLAGLAIVVGLALTQAHTRPYVRWNPRFFAHIREYGVLAADIGLNTGSTLLALLIFVGIIKDLGPAALAVHQITLQIFNFSYLPSVGFLIAASIIVAPLSAGDATHLLKPTVFRIGRMSLGVTSLTCFCLYVSAPAVSRFFSPTDAVVAAQTVQTLKLVCCGQLFSAVYMVLRGTLTACRATRFILYEGLFSAYAVFLPLAWLLAIRLEYGVYGGYLAFLAWCATDCLILAWRFRRQAKTA